VRETAKSPASWKKPKSTDIRSPSSQRGDASWASTSSIQTSFCQNSSRMQKTQIPPRLRPRHPAQATRRVKMHAYNFIDENKQRALYCAMWDPGAYYEANMDVAGITPSSTSTTRAGPCAPAPISTRRQVRLRRAGRTAWPSTPSSAPLHRLRRGHPQLRRLPGRARQLLCGCRFFDHLLHVNVGRHCRIRHAIIDAMCIFRRHVIATTQRGQEELLCLRERPHRRHPRLLRLREPVSPEFCSKAIAGSRILFNVVTYLHWRCACITTLSSREFNQGASRARRPRGRARLCHQPRSAQPRPAQR